MVPDKSHPRFRELATGRHVHPFPTLAANLCVANNLRQVRAAGAGPTILPVAIDNIHAFFAKFEDDLSDELRRIFA